MTSADYPRPSQARWAASRSGAFGRALQGVDPQKLANSDQAYLRFFLLAIINSLREARRSVDNRELVVDVMTGLELLAENATFPFGFPPIRPEHTGIHAAPSQTFVTELALEPAPDSSGRTPTAHADLQNS
jgi:hypothetical protein